MKLKYKIMILFILVILMLNLGLGFYTVNSIHNKVIESAQEKLKSDLALGRTLLNERYPGEWIIKDGHLYKGKFIMNNKFDIVDEIGMLTGDTVTIFQGDTRIVTNVKDHNGNRAVGTKVSEVVANTVLKEGKKYIGKANVVGVWNLTAYEPIKNDDGEIIGIWYVGVPNTIYDILATDLRINIIFITLIGLVFGSLCSWIVVDRFTHPLSILEQTANKIALGKLESNIEIKSKDEIGKLANSFNIMVLKIREIAYHDYLTGLYNRRAMMNCLKEKTKQFEKEQQNYCILLCDIDHFKKINDQYGHDVGDEALKSIAKILKNNLRPEDMLARWGGEEFLILLSNSNKNEAVLIADFLREIIEKTLVKIDNVSITVTMSFGVSDFNECSSYYDTIKKADNALYKSKESGRNKVTSDC